MSHSPMSDIPPAEREAITARWNSHPGMKHMGVRLDLSRRECVRVYVDPIREYHRGGLGTDAVNGAIIAGVFDLAVGLIGHLSTPGQRVGTAQLNIHFVQPVRGDRFEVLGRLIRAGRSLVFAAAELLDESGQLCARCDGIVAVAGAASSRTDEMPL